MKPKDIIMVTFSGGTKSLVRVCGDFDIDNPTKINVVFILDVITSDGTYSCNNTINSDFIEHITRDNYDKIIAEIFTSTNIDKLKEEAGKTEKKSNFSERIKKTFSLALGNYIKLPANDIEAIFINPE